MSASLLPITKLPPGIATHSRSGKDTDVLVGVQVGAGDGVSVGGGVGVSAGGGVEVGILVGVGIGVLADGGGEGVGISVGGRVEVGILVGVEAIGIWAAGTSVDNATGVGVNAGDSTSNTPAMISPLIPMTITTSPMPISRPYCDQTVGIGVAVAWDE
jgi:hypothetical protein